MEVRLKSGHVLRIDNFDWNHEFVNYTKSGIAYRFRPCDLTWYLHDNRRGKQSVVSCVSVGSSKRRYTVYLSRLLCEVKSGEYVHHVNGNALDNTRCNLAVRSFTRLKKASFSTNRYKGVVKERNRYSAVVSLGGVRRRVASCETALEAAICFDDAARKYYGELAVVNFPERHYKQSVFARTTARRYEHKGSFNAYSNCGPTLEVELPCGKRFTVNRNDWFDQRLGYRKDGTAYAFQACEISWQATNKGYVFSRQDGKPVLLHRLVTGCPAHLVVDHIDGNPLNNTRDNLRICTNADNLKNQRKRKPGKYKYKGVYRENKNSYLVHIQADWRITRRYKFKTALEAALAYDNLALELHGKYACLNFPEKHRSKAIA